MSSSLEQELAELPGRQEGAYFGGFQEVTDAPQHEFSLPPVDGGKDAWLLLTSCFFLEAFVWGFPVGFGVLEDYYSSHDPFASQSSNVAIIGTVALGILYLGSPFSLAVFQRWPQHRRRSSVAGLFLSSAALALSALSNRVWQLILTQGVLYAIGGSMLYYPSLIYIDEWFVRRKGLAYGVVWAGTASFGITVPFIVTWSLSRFSFRTTLLAWALIMFFTVGPLLKFAKPRLPISSGHHIRQTSFGFIFSSSFFFYQLGNVLQGLGYYMPSIYLPSYAKALGQSSTSGTAALALVNLGALFGCICTGYMIDRWDVTVVIIILTAGATFSSLVLWGFSTYVPLLYIFSISYGLSAGSFSTTWSAVARDIAVKNGIVDIKMVYGLLIAGRGIGSIVSGPLSEGLLKTRLLSGEKAFAYSTEYGSLILFTTVTMLLGGMGFGAKKLGWI